MAQPQPIDQQVIKDVQVFYDPKGRPASVILPFDLFSRLVPRSAEIAEKVYPLSDNQIVAAVDDIRSQFFQKRYAAQIANSS